MTPITTLKHLLAIVEGKRPMEDVEKYIHPNAVFHMGSFKSKGLSGWKKWVKFLLHGTQIKSPKLELLSSEQCSKGLKIWVKATGIRHGKQIESEAKSFIYRFEAGRVVEIWTSPDNYDFYFGQVSKGGIFSIIRRQLQVEYWNLFKSKA